jgi:glycosyltransferase involved in cell wall biosynthesis
MKRIGMIGPFDPTLCDGVSSSMFDLFVFFKKQGHEVFIVSFMHDTPLARNHLQYLLSREGITIIKKGDNFCNVIYEGINIYWELLPYSRIEMLNARPEVLKRTLSKLKEYSQSFIFTIDRDFTSLLSNCMTDNPGAHFFHSPNNIQSFAGNPFYMNLLKKRTVFVVTKSFQNEMRNDFDVHAVYWPPFINVKRYRARKKDNKSIGFYSAGPHKGDKLFNKLIEKMPHIEFVVIGRNYNLDSTIIPKNLKYMGDITDPRLFYKEISLLVVPSLIAEGYPRVIMEASSNGIPTIANKVGGIPECLGDGGIMIDIEQSENKIVDQYISTINKLLSDPREYAKYSEKAIKRTAEYEEELHKVSINNYNKYLI